jgi:hypothetical protein
VDRGQSRPAPAAARPGPLRRVCGGPRRSRHPELLRAHRSRPAGDLHRDPGGGALVRQPQPGPPFRCPRTDPRPSCPPGFRDPPPTPSSQEHS